MNISDCMVVSKAGTMVAASATSMSVLSPERGRVGVSTRMREFVRGCERVCKHESVCERVQERVCLRGV